VLVKVKWLDLVDDPLLSFAMVEGFVIVFERKLVDVLIRTFSDVFRNFPADLKITIGC